MPAVSLPSDLLDEHAKTVGPYGLAVLITLVRFDRAPISYQEIAEYTGMTRQQAMNIVKRLISLDLIQKQAVGYTVSGVHASSKCGLLDHRLVNVVDQTPVYPNERPTAGMWKTLEAQFGASVVNAVRPALEVKAAAGEVKSLSGLASKVCKEEAERQRAEQAKLPTPAQIEKSNAAQSALAEQLQREQDALFSALGV